MKKILKVLSVLTVCTAIIAMGGCNLMNNQSDEDDIEIPKVNLSSQEDSKAENLPYKWLIEPTVDADNIIVFDGGQVNPDKVENTAYKKCVVYKDDGKYGFMDYKGNKIVQAEYDDYFFCWCGEIVLFNREIDENSKEKYTKTCTLTDSLQPVSRFTQHENDQTRYYYSEEKNEVYAVNADGSNPQKYTDKKAVVVQSANITFEEREQDGEKKEVVAKIDSVSNIYGIYKEGKLVAPIEYADAYCPAFKSAGSTGICLKKDGKWGYLTINGDVLIDFNCDGVASSYNGSLMDNDIDLHPYLFNGEFVPIVRDGRAGYYNSRGEEVVPIGEFEQARPIYNGRGWVKKDGRWGVINLGELKDDEPKKSDKSSKKDNSSSSINIDTGTTTASWTSNTTATTPKSETKKQEQTTSNYQEEQTTPPPETTTPPPETTTPPPETTTSPPETTTPPPQTTTPPPETTPASSPQTPAPEPPAPEQPAENNE